jgi:hypothetical protein
MLTTRRRPTGVPAGREDGHPHRRRVRLARGLLAAFALMAGATVAVGLTPSPASAYCIGGYNEWYYAGGVAGNWGLESDADEGPNTCDGDYYYHGEIADTFTDGSCVWVEYADFDFQGRVATSCDDFGADYAYVDGRGNNAAYIRVCRNQGCDGWVANYGY